MARPRASSVLVCLTAAAIGLTLTACGDDAKRQMKDVRRPVGKSADYAVFADAKSEAPPRTENYLHFVENGYVSAAAEPRSTFSASVDTASYSLIRAKIEAGERPPKDAVRIADLLNYFNYDYPQPAEGVPVAATLEMAPCPWNSKHMLLRIALAARRIDPADMPARNFVFLIDTSGSMGPDNRLPLVKRSLNLLVETLRPQDSVSIVTYAGEASLRLGPTAGDQRRTILAAINALSAGGSTNGGGGIQMAYDQAARGFRENGVNRVILATDGDFNVGTTSDGELIRMIEERRKTGIYLTVLGFGMGNLQDGKLEQLARHGNGHYAYIDSLDEARKLFIEQGGALTTVAKDVKLQVEFNHNRVNAYRLIGYENRVMRNEDFRNDSKDAGDMGSGHTVTALYEVVPTGVSVDLKSAGDLKYQEKPTDRPAARSGEWLTFRVRYKDPGTEEADEIEFPLGKDMASVKPTADFRFAAAVAAFGLLLRDSEYKGSASWSDVKSWAATSLAKDVHGHRRDFLRLVERAEGLARGRD